MKLRIRRLVPLFILCAVVLSGSTAWAQKPTAPPTKGQGQLVGGTGRFGAIYTLKNQASNWNFVIYSAHYSLEPYACYMNGSAPRTKEKLLTFDIAIKNVAPDNNSLNSSGMFTAVDTTGALYKDFDLTQDSRGNKEFMSSLRPGQGIGQPDLKDPVHVIFHVPGDARIVKLMVNVGRKFAPEDERVFRYYIAGATKAEAGEDGDPKNVIAALPANVADPSGKSGAIALDEGIGALGQELASGAYHLKLNSGAATTEPVTGNPPPNSKKFVVLNVTATMLIDSRDRSMFYLDGNGWQLMDMDGERYGSDCLLNASSKENADHRFEKGDQYTFRVVFVVPTDAKFKKVVIGARDSRKWAFDGSIIR